MLPAKVYQLLHRYACDIGDGDILEIGAAHGAGTVSLALGVQDGGRSGTVVAVEKGEGGSRAEFGSKERNIKILENNLREFGVSDSVVLVDEHLTRDGNLPEKIQSPAPFSLVCLDADGKLDRDFQRLYDNIRPGAIIVIDDYSPLRAYREQTPRYPLGGGKHYRSLCYANWLLDNGFLHRYRLIEQTLITVKPPDVPDLADLENMENLQVHLDKDRERHG